MSQAADWGVPGAGPASPTTVTGRTNASLNALLSQHRGENRPAYAVGGTIWVDDSDSDGVWTLYFFDGAQDIALATIDVATNTVSYLAANVSYDNVASGLVATNVQAAIDELAAGTGSGTGGTMSAKTADFSIADDDSGITYVVTPSGSSADGTLPAADSVDVGYEVTIKNMTDGKGVRFLITGDDTIDGQTSFRVPGREAVTVRKIDDDTWMVKQRPSYAVGDVIPWFTNTIREGGWQWINDADISRTTYAGLFAVWGTTHGVGDGSTTFGLVDARGRVLAGKDDMGGASAASRLTSGGSGVDGTTVGAAGGSQTHTLITGEMPSHNHGSASGSFVNNSSVGVYAVSGSAELNLSGGTSSNTANSGSGSPHNNTQPTIITNFIVKT